jgi:hypothetical protein
MTNYCKASVVGFGDDQSADQRVWRHAVDEVGYTLNRPRMWSTAAGGWVSTRLQPDEVGKTCHRQSLEVLRGDYFFD